MLTTSEQEPAPVECRICHSKTTRDLILSPCLCKGSMAHVHFRCLERWLNYSSRDSCELCSYKFNVVLNRRYSCLQSLRVWFRHPTNRAFILCDLMIGLVLTSLTLGLILVCLMGLNHFVKDSTETGIQSVWSEGIIDCFLMILLAGYLATMYSMAKDHIRPWYMWWTRCNNVKLVIDKNDGAVPLSQESSENVAVNLDKNDTTIIIPPQKSTDSVEVNVEKNPPTCDVKGSVIKKNIKSSDVKVELNRAEKEDELISIIPDENKSEVNIITGKTILKKEILCTESPSTSGECTKIRLYLETSL